MNKIDNNTQLAEHVEIPWVLTTNIIYISCSSLTFACIFLFSPLLPDYVLFKCYTKISFIYKKGIRYTLHLLFSFFCSVST